MGYVQRARSAWAAFLVATALATIPATAGPAKLANGDAFPPLQAESVSGSQIVPSGSEDDAVIVAVDKSGAVTDIERRAFSDTAASDLARTLAIRPSP